ncbi:hypothetical protein FQN54_004452, partial [Arachnomyces sp. PD_36]
AAERLNSVLNSVEEGHRRDAQVAAVEERIKNGVDSHNQIIPIPVSEQKMIDLLTDEEKEKDKQNDAAKITYARKEWDDDDFPDYLIQRSS